MWCENLNVITAVSEFMSWQDMINIERQTNPPIVFYNLIKKREKEIFENLVVTYNLKLKTIENDPYSYERQKAESKLWIFQLKAWVWKYRINTNHPDYLTYVENRYKELFAYHGVCNCYDIDRDVRLLTCKQIRKRDEEQRSDNWYQFFIGHEFSKYQLTPEYEDLYPNLGHIVNVERNGILERKYQFKG